MSDERERYFRRLRESIELLRLTGADSDRVGHATIVRQHLREDELLAVMDRAGPLVEEETRMRRGKRGRRA